jgi:glutaredoxin 3
MLALDVLLINKQKMSDITIYTKDYCPFCIKAKSLLVLKKVKFTEINLHQHPEKFEEMMKKSNGAQTVPQIFSSEKYIGDCDKLYELNAQGKLDQLLGI